MMVFISCTYTIKPLINYSNYFVFGASCLLARVPLVASGVGAAAALALAARTLLPPEVGVIGRLGLALHRREFS